MSNQSISNEPIFDLSSLSRVPLSPHHAAMLQNALARSGGPPHWRNKKSAEARDLLALAQLSRRLLILGLDLAVDLRVNFIMRVTVPLMPVSNGPLQIADSAGIGLVYREESTRTPQPGYSWAEILSPRGVWLPNVSGPPAPAQALCLGNLPVGVPVKELILIIYRLLCVGEIQMNPADSAGLLNPAAAEWWQRSAASLAPLSREPFLEPHPLAA